MAKLLLSGLFRSSWLNMYLNIVSRHFPLHVAGLAM